MITLTTLHSFLLATLLPQSLQRSDRDITKQAVELPLESALPSTVRGVPSMVAPGLVPWHADFDAACAAAARSHRPVLLFQLLGKLDEEFC